MYEKSLLYQCISDNIEIRLWEVDKPIHISVDALISYLPIPTSARDTNHYLYARAGIVQVI